MIQPIGPGDRSWMRDSLGLCLLNAVLVAFGIWTTLSSQTIARQPALSDVMTIHLSRTGDLRLWNQPILAQDLPKLLQRAHARSTSEKRVVVRLIPDAQVPWGVVHRMLTRLQPSPPSRVWILQLQLP